MGYPYDYTLPVRRSRRGESPQQIAWRRQSLLGNSWYIFVTRFWLVSLVIPFARRAGVNLSMAGPSSAADPRVDTPPSQFEEVYLLLRERCPYNVDRRARGLSCENPLGPDRAEQSAHRVFSRELGVQGRADTTTGGFPCLLPSGLTPELHYVCALSCVHPLLEVPSLPDDLDFAVRQTAKFFHGWCGPTGVAQGTPSRAQSGMQQCIGP